MSLWVNVKNIFVYNSVYYKDWMPARAPAVKGYLLWCPSVSRCFLWVYLVRKYCNETCSVTKDDDELRGWVNGTKWQTLPVFLEGGVASPCHSPTYDATCCELPSYLSEKTISAELQWNQSETMLTSISWKKENSSFFCSTLWRFQSERENRDVSGSRNSCRSSVIIWRRHLRMNLKV